MKKMYVAAAMVLTILLSCATLSQAGENLLTNPGFENDFLCWSKDGFGSPGIVNDTKRSGNFAARLLLSHVSWHADYWQELYQTVDFAAGQPVYANIYVRTSLVTGLALESGVAVLIIDLLDADGGVLKEVASTPVGCNTDWMLLEAAYPAAPAGTVKARIRIATWGPPHDNDGGCGNAYFDDAYLGSGYYPVLDRKLVNPGFENRFSGWRELWGDPASISNLVAHTGASSAVKSITSVSAQEYWSQLYQDVPCVGRKKFTASVYVNTDFPKKKSEARAGLQIQLLDGEKNVVKTLRLKKLKKDTGWKRLVIMHQIPKEAVFVRLSCFIYAPMGDVESVGSEAYFDNADLKLK